MRLTHQMTLNFWLRDERSGETCREMVKGQWRWRWNFECQQKFENVSNGVSVIEKLTLNLLQTQSLFVCVYVCVSVCWYDNSKGVKETLIS